MEPTFIIVFTVVAVFAAIAVALARGASKKRRDRAIAEALDAIRSGAEKSRIKGIEVPEVDVSDAFTQLETFARDCPADVSADVAAIKERWTEIQRRVREFNAQDTVSTMQSSLTLTRTEKLVTEIHDLSRKVETGLGAKSL